jgi:hypothetical protein
MSEGNLLSTPGEVARDFDSGLRIHAICLALNEEIFIGNQLASLYPFCSGISVVTQYDRDWSGKPVKPDATVETVLRFPDPKGRIHLAVRRGCDEAAARNSEMLFFNPRSIARVASHARRQDEMRRFYDEPDYFLIVDADEFYDVDTLPRVLEYLRRHKPKGMRMWGYNYARTWNHRCPIEVVPFCHFGFVRPGITFEHRRTVTWNESRASKGLRLLRLPDVASRLWGFTVCPVEVGVFHHGCWLGSDERLKFKVAVSSHRLEPGMATEADVGVRVDQLATTFVATEQLPRNIRQGAWPPGYLAPPSSVQRQA